MKAAADRGGKTITIIGGGLTGCELASILSYNIAGGEKCKIIHLVREDFVLEKYVPRFLGEYIGPQLKEAVSQPLLLICSLCQSLLHILVVLMNTFFLSPSRVLMFAQTKTSS